MIEKADDEEIPQRTACEAPAGASVDEDEEARDQEGASGGEVEAAETVESLLHGPCLP
ncbi:hypothetical protein JQX13_42285 [Archangium violaceum]|uniref:hypothetical protein n=1 Tax=Archangium violaceum TaxID=83451 RepID=UPI00193BDA84|nr:hypothetical protein [Archangium violaceum]QRK06644.1 hypothetical protein JQX13_42285 [Archangium violaceum]